MPLGQASGLGWPWKEKSVVEKTTVRLKTGRILWTQRAIARSHSSRWPPYSSFQSRFRQTSTFNRRSSFKTLEKLEHPPRIHELHETKDPVPDATRSMVIAEFLLFGVVELPPNWILGTRKIRENSLQFRIGEEPSREQRGETVRPRNTGLAARKDR